MISKIHKGGKGMDGALGYVLQDDQDPEIIGGTVVGKDRREISREIASSRAAANHLKEPVWHASISYQRADMEAGLLTPERRSEVATGYIQALLDRDWQCQTNEAARRGNEPPERPNAEDFPYLVVSHHKADGADNPHDHILLLRCSDKGYTFQRRFEREVSEAYDREAEHEHGLTPLPSRSQQQSRTEPHPVDRESYVTRRHHGQPPLDKDHVAAEARQIMDSLPPEGRTVEEYAKALSEQGLVLYREESEKGRERFSIGIQDGERWRVNVLRINVRKDLANLPSQAIAIDHRLPEAPKAEMPADGAPAPTQSKPLAGSPQEAGKVIGSIQGSLGAQKDAESLREVSNAPQRASKETAEEAWERFRRELIKRFQDASSDATFAGTEEWMHVQRVELGEIRDRKERSAGWGVSLIDGKPETKRLASFGKPGKALEQTLERGQKWEPWQERAAKVGEGFERAVRETEKSGTRSWEALVENAHRFGVHIEKPNLNNSQEKYPAYKIGRLSESGKDFAQIVEKGQLKPEAWSESTFNLKRKDRSSIGDGLKRWQGGERFFVDDAQVARMNAQKAVAHAIRAAETSRKTTQSDLAKELKARGYGLKEEKTGFLGFRKTSYRVQELKSDEGQPSSWKTSQLGFTGSEANFHAGLRRWSKGIPFLRSQKDEQRDEQSQRVDLARRFQAAVAKVEADREGFFGANPSKAKLVKALTKNGVRLRDERGWFGLGPVKGHKVEYIPTEGRSFTHGFSAASLGFKGRDASIFSGLRRWERGERFFAGPVHVPQQRPSTRLAPFQPKTNPITPQVTALNHGFIKPETPTGERRKTFAERLNELREKGQSVSESWKKRRAAKPLPEREAMRPKRWGTTYTPKRRMFTDSDPTGVVPSDQPPTIEKSGQRKQKTRERDRL